MYDERNHTVELLRKLKPGQRLRYYQGPEFDNIQGPEPYRRLMHEIRVEADQLVIRGLIKVTKEKLFFRADKSGYHETVYTAIALE